ncbi:hypothetical protein F4553_001049 [Allocatelliglobosispora scoriae]|uniref:Nucleotidyltransferase family protein n=1 Tax=Allocatelliglobosispora scoriae TaxID=643052 RepID=A0A841BLH6_9ACTN|nr:nucleotidyltransferase family protein [Allocatelliglobosispora scoriae]MBB5867670.1 hypothetical protein [Allocatelliglobosispora scoriae]
MPNSVSAELLVTMKRAATVLKEHQVPFALAGGFAVYARGGSGSEHDVDFLIRREDADKALKLLAAAGFSTERPPEDWLVKVYDQHRLVDLIFEPVGLPVTDATLADTTLMRVEAIEMPVLSATTLMSYKLLSFTEQYCDYTRALPLARSLREQIDWERVRADTKPSPYARSFLFLLEQLDVLPHRRHGEQE